MNVLAPTFTAPAILDGSIETVVDLYAYTFSYFGYAYFYIFLSAGDT